MGSQNYPFIPASAAESSVLSRCLGFPSFTIPQVDGRLEFLSQFPMSDYDGSAGVVREASSAVDAIEPYRN
jgi:hypothetical protein